MIWGASFSEKPWNEDVWAASGQWAFVLDGASGLSSVSHMAPLTDAAWLVQGLKAWLMEHILDEDSLESIVRSGIQSLQTVWQQAGGLESPSCTITCLRIHNGQLEYYVLGDSLLLIETPQEVLRFCDPAVEKLDALVIQRMQQLSMEKMEPFLEMRPYVSDMLQKHRHMKNTPEGYWICDLSAEGLPHALQGSLPLEQVQRTALMSDGMMQLQAFRELPDDGFLDLLYRRRAGCFEQLILLQEEDKRCRRVPRLKKRDDTTLVLWTPPQDE